MGGKDRHWRGGKINRDGKINKDSEINRSRKFNKSRDSHEMRVYFHPNPRTPESSRGPKTQSRVCALLSTVLLLLLACSVGLPGSRLLGDYPAGDSTRLNRTQQDDSRRDAVIGQRGGR